MRHGFDISDPSGQVFTGFDVAGGYIGGRTPHVWTKGQWDAQPARWRCPFWTWNATVGGGDQGAEAAAAMKRLGAPAGSIVFLDMETDQAPAGVDHFAAALHDAGYTCGVYGSTSTLFGNPQRAGYFAADPTGAPHLNSHGGVVATQYGQAVVHGATVDLDVFADHVPLWDTQPGGGPQLPVWAHNAIVDLQHVAAVCRDVQALISANVK